MNASPHGALRLSSANTRMDARLDRMTRAKVEELAIAFHHQPIWTSSAAVA